MAEGGVKQLTLQTCSISPNPSVRMKKQLRKSVNHLCIEVDSTVADTNSPTFSLLDSVGWTNLRYRTLEPLVYGDRSQITKAIFSSK